MILNQQPKCTELGERGQLLLAAFPIEENRNGVYVLICFAQPNVNYHKLFSLYTNANSYKDNTEFDGLVAQAIKHP